MKYLLIDCDPGHDDALAIMTAYANSEEFKILGISTVGGNHSLDNITRNTQEILAFLKADIPLASGQSGPLVRPLETGEYAHGSSGLDGPKLESADYPIASRNGVTFLYEKIMECREKVVIAAMAPLTNIALLIKAFPEVKGKIEAISLMGGGIHHGNCTEIAEFNIYVDPEAAYIVFHSGIPIIMSGLDMTEKAAITKDEIETLANKGKASRLAYELLKFYYESGKQFGFKTSAIHDLCTVGYFLKPDIFQGSRYYVDVITDSVKARGMTFADRRVIPGHVENALVLEEVDRKQFVAMLFEALEYLDEQMKEG